MRIGLGWSAAVFAVALWPQVGRAASVNLGYVSFDVLIPGSPGNPGVDGFTINNLTGDPGLGGAALPPDFNVFTFVTLANASLSVAGDVNQTFLLGDIPPGSFSSPALQFPDSTNFTSAVFAATLSTTTFLLADGTSFTAGSPALSTTLLPSTGPSLAAGTDLAVLQVSGTQSTTPEPASAWLMAGALGAFAFAHQRQRG